VPGFSVGKNGPCEVAWVISGVRFLSSDLLKMGWFGALGCDLIGRLECTVIRTKL